MAEILCPVCGEPIKGAEYKCAGIDRSSWKTIIVHRNCWERRHELEGPGVAIVQDPEPANA